MKKADILLFAVVVLWGIGSWYIAASHEDHNASLLGFAWLNPPKGLSHETHWFMGYIIFLLSFVTIVVWTTTRKE